MAQLARWLSAHTEAQAGFQTHSPGTDKLRSHPLRGEKLLSFQLPYELIPPAEEVKLEMDFQPRLPTRRTLSTALRRSLCTTAFSNEAIDGAVLCSLVPAKPLLPPIQLHKMRSPGAAKRPFSCQRKRS